MWEFASKRKCDPGSRVTGTSLRERRGDGGGRVARTCPIRLLAHRDTLVAQAATQSQQDSRFEETRGHVPGSFRQKMSAEGRRWTVFPQYAGRTWLMFVMIPRCTMSTEQWSNAETNVRASLHVDTR